MGHPKRSAAETPKRQNPGAAVTQSTRHLCESGVTWAVFQNFNAFTCNGVFLRNCFSNSNFNLCRGSEYYFHYWSRSCRWQVQSVWTSWTCQSFNTLSINSYDCSVIFMANHSRHADVMSSDHCCSSTATFLQCLSSCRKLFERPQFALADSAVHNFQCQWSLPM